jgi:hypothetical protein
MNRNGVAQKEIDPEKGPINQQLTTRRMSSGGDGDCFFSMSQVLTTFHFRHPLRGEVILALSPGRAERHNVSTLVMG